MVFRNSNINYPYAFERDLLEVRESDSRSSSPVLSPHEDDNSDLVPSFDPPINTEAVERDFNQLFSDWDFLRKNTSTADNASNSSLEPTLPGKSSIQPSSADVQSGTAPQVVQAKANLSKASVETSQDLRPGVLQNSHGLSRQKGASLVTNKSDQREKLATKRYTKASKKSAKAVNKATKKLAQEIQFKSRLSQAIEPSQELYWGALSHKTGIPVNQVEYLINNNSDLYEKWKIACFTQLTEKATQVAKEAAQLRSKLSKALEDSPGISFKSLGKRVGLTIPEVKKSIENDSDLYIKWEEACKAQTAQKADKKVAQLKSRLSQVIETSQDFRPEELGNQIGLTGYIVKKLIENDSDLSTQLKEARKAQTDKEAAEEIQFKLRISQAIETSQDLRPGALGNQIGLTAHKVKKLIEKDSDLYIKWEEARKAQADKEAAEEIQLKPRLYEVIETSSNLSWDALARTTEARRRCIRRIIEKDSNLFTKLKEARKAQTAQKAAEKAAEEDRFRSRLSQAIEDSQDMRHSELSTYLGIGKKKLRKILEENSDLFNKWKELNNAQRTKRRKAQASQEVNKSIRIKGAQKEKWKAKTSKMIQEQTQTVPSKKLRNSSDGLVEVFSRSTQAQVLQIKSIPKLTTSKKRKLSSE